MLPFLYFLPPSPLPIAERIRDLGLSAVIDKPRLAKVLANGPNGGGGDVVCDASFDHVPQVHMNEQVWRAAPKRGGDQVPYWIGWYKDSRPTPALLAKSRSIDGESIILHDGTKWNVPRLMEWRESDLHTVVFRTKLPQILDINDDGDLVPSRIDPKYEAVWDDGWRAHDALVGQAVDTGRAVMTKAEANDLACRVLNINYRVGPIEVACLGLFDEELAIDVVKIAIQNRQFWDLVKNLSGRLGATTTSSHSGAERPTQE